MLFLVSSNPVCTPTSLGWDLGSSKEIWVLVSCKGLISKRMLLAAKKMQVASLETRVPPESEVSTSKVPTVLATSHELLWSGLHRAQPLLF